MTDNSQQTSLDCKNCSQKFDYSSMASKEGDFLTYCSLMEAIKAPVSYFFHKISRKWSHIDSLLYNAERSATVSLGGFHGIVDCDQYKAPHYCLVTTTALRQAPTFQNSGVLSHVIKISQSFPSCSNCSNLVLESTGEQTFFSLCNCPFLTFTMYLGQKSTGTSSFISTNTENFLQCSI